MSSAYQYLVSAVVEFASRYPSIPNFNGTTFVANIPLATFRVGEFAVALNIAHIGTARAVVSVLVEDGVGSIENSRFYDIDPASISEMFAYITNLK